MQKCHVVLKGCMSLKGSFPTALYQVAESKSFADLSPLFFFQVMLQLEKKLFDYFNQDVFRDNNGTAVSSLLNTFEGISWKLTY